MPDPEFIIQTADKLIHKSKVFPYIEKDHKHPPDEFHLETKSGKRRSYKLFRYSKQPKSEVIEYHEYE